MIKPDYYADTVISSSASTSVVAMLATAHMAGFPQVQAIVTEKGSAGDDDLTRALEDDSKSADETVENDPLKQKNLALAKSLSDARLCLLSSKLDVEKLRKENEALVQALSSGKDTVKLQGYRDANMKVDFDTRKSTSGYVFEVAVGGFSQCFKLV